MFFFFKKGNLEMIYEGYDRQSTWGAISIAQVRYDEDSQSLKIGDRGP